MLRLGGSQGGGAEGQHGDDARDLHVERDILIRDEKMLGLVESRLRGMRKV
jgi:hypothetical protein